MPPRDRFFFRTMVPRSVRRADRVLTVSEQTKRDVIEEYGTPEAKIVVTPNGVDSAFTAGFCFGGSQSWRQSAAQPGLAGAIGFYGRPVNARDAIPKMKAPLLLLIAGSDAATSQDEFDRFDQELTDAGVPHKKVVYEGAPHSFFDRSFEQHQAASEDAWRQMLDFIKESIRQPARA